MRGRFAASSLLAVVLLSGSSPAAGGTRADGRARRPNPLIIVARLHRQAEREQGRSAIGAASSRASRAPLIFYIDSVHGLDSNPGTSPQQPWRSLSRASGNHYVGGDEIRLRAGERFPQTLRLSSENVTGASRLAPLTLGSYPAGRATITPPAGSGLVVVNTSGVRISDLNFAGPRRGCRASGNGIFFDARDRAGTLGGGVSIARVDEAGFCRGIVIGSEDDGSRIDQVRISQVAAHDNGDAGIITYDSAFKHHEIRDVSVTRTRAFRNADEGGIVLFGVERGLVEHSVAFGNGRGHGGDVGIWAFDSDRIRLVHDESFGNMTISDDGDGFDLDGGVTNSTMAYDYAHDNQGIGFLICACVGYFYPQHGDVVAGNVSVDDGSSGQTSAIYLGGGAPFSNVAVFSNGSYSRRGSGPLVSVDGAFAPFADVHFHDNTFISGAGKVLLYADASDGRRLSFSRDRWVSCQRSFSVQWGSRSFSSLAAWRRRTGEERGGSQRAPRNRCGDAWWRALARSTHLPGG